MTGFFLTASIIAIAIANGNVGTLRTLIPNVESPLLLGLAIWNAATFGLLSAILQGGKKIFSCVLVQTILVPATFLVVTFFANTSRWRY